MGMLGRQDSVNWRSVMRLMIGGYGSGSGTPDLCLLKSWYWSPIGRFGLLSKAGTKTAPFTHSPVITTNRLLQDTAKIRTPE